MKRKRLPLHALMRKQFPHFSPDQILVKILSGQTYVNGEKVREKSALVPEDGMIQFCNPRPFVSRGGEKLNHILEVWDYPVQGRTFLDAGCSTGGFSHCLLSRGAVHVHAVDVGFNQFDFHLKRDPRITLFEETNIKDLDPGLLRPVPEAAVCDLSFRSIKGVGALIFSLIKGDELIALIKPQFEYTGGQENFSGVVRDDELLFSIVDSLIFHIRQEGLGLRRIGLSPITGRKGNREFFFLITRSASGSLEENRAELRALFSQFLCT